MNDTTITPRLLNYRQAAQYLGVCEKSIYNLVKSGQIQPVHVGGSVRFARDDLDAFIVAAKGEKN